MLSCYCKENNITWQVTCGADAWCYWWFTWRFLWVVPQPQSELLPPWSPGWIPPEARHPHRYQLRPQTRPERKHERVKHRRTSHHKHTHRTFSTQSRCEWTFQDPFLMWANFTLSRFFMLEVHSLLCKLSSSALSSKTSSPLTGRALTQDMTI